MTSTAASAPRGAIARTWERIRRPNREHCEKLSARVPFWFVALVLFGFALLQIALNPFGFSDLTQRYAQDVANLLITGPYLYPTTGRDQVTVARIDEETLHNLQMPWPWSYGQHARALDTLLSYRPKAVIVDFLFVDPRNDDTLKDLVDEIARFRRAHVPLYFEGGTDLPYGEDPLLPALAGTGVPVLDPTIQTYDGVVRQYPASGACFGPKGRLPGTCPSLALRVYADLHPDHPPAPLNGVVELVWGTRTAPLNLKLNHDAAGNRLPCARDDGFLLRIYNAFFDKQTAMANCPYTTVVPVEALLDGLEDKDIDAAIPGHVVFYGGSLEGAQDKSYTPVNKLQANVFVHAMALDNLITFAGDPEQNVMTIGGYTFGNEPAQVFAIVPVILILSFLHIRRVRRRRNAKGEVERSALYEWFVDKGLESFWYWFGYALALGIGLLLAWGVGLSVANWVEDVFVSAELGVMLLLGVPDQAWGYLHHCAGGVPDGTLQEATT